MRRGFRAAFCYPNFIWVNIIRVFCYPIFWKVNIFQMFCYPIFIWVNIRRIFCYPIYKWDNKKALSRSVARVWQVRLIHLRRADTRFQFSVDDG